MSYSTMSLGDFLLRHGSSLEPFIMRLEHGFVFGEKAPHTDVVSAVLGCEGCKRDLHLEEGLPLLWVKAHDLFMGPFCVRCDPPDPFVARRLGVSAGTPVSVVKTKAYKLSSVRAMLGDLFVDLWPEPQDPLAYFG